LAGRRRLLAWVSAALLLAGVVAAVFLHSPQRLEQDASSQTTAAQPARPQGGQLVVSVRSEPQTFNRYTRRDSTTDLLSTFLNAKLVRINRVTQEVEPWLADSWTRSEDGLRYTLKLKPGLMFSDGRPFTSADVVFSLEAACDEASGSVLREALSVAGHPLRAVAEGDETVVIEFPEVFAPGVRLLDNLPILPRHALDDAWREGRFGTAWGLGTPPQDLVGLGPFILAEYIPGQRVVLSRNPHYFRRDANGVQLPYLDRVVVEIIPDQNAELLRLVSGDIDATSSEVRPEDYAPLKRAADEGRVRLLDLGVALDADSFWMNLTPGAFARDARAGWIQRDELRQAIALAVDRQRFADTVFLGAGVPVFGPTTPANKQWYSPDLPQTMFDPARARRLLASIGLADRNADGQLEDAKGTPARFTVLTQQGRSALERGAGVIRDDLAKVGVTVDVVTLDVGSLIQRFAGSRDYDAVYFSVLASDTDPAISQDFWLSRGSAHVWNIGQAHPATAWEARIDQLMADQTRAADVGERKRLFDEVQQILAEHLPVLHFVAPRIFAAAAARVIEVTPAVARPQLLWAPDTIAVRP